MKLKKIMMYVMMAGFLWTIMPVTSFAAINPSAETQADVIETCFRIYNDRLQYRHWNRTKGRWVEPDWITC